MGLRHKDWPIAEAHLRGYFEGSVEGVAGLKSNMGPMLDRAKEGTQPAATDDPEREMHAAMREMRLNNIAKAALSELTDYQRNLLRCFYEPFPVGRVWGLVEACGKELARVLVCTSEPSATDGTQRTTAVECYRRAMKNGARSPEAQAWRDRLRQIRLDVDRAERDYFKAWRQAWRDSQRVRRSSETEQLCKVLRFVQEEM